jgi:hypothetical protein
MVGYEGTRCVGTPRSRSRSSGVRHRPHLGDDVLRSGGWSQADTSVTASQQFPLFVLGKFGLGRIPTGVAEFSPLPPSRHGQRTSSADRARHGEGGAKHQKLSPDALPSKGCGDDEDPGQQKATHDAPRRKARKRHAINPATAIDNYEDPGEYDAGNKAERSKQEGKREVGVDTGHPRQQNARTKPCCSPGEAHPDCRADASPHFFMATSRRSIGRAIRVLAIE